MSDDSFTSGFAAALLVEEGKGEVAKELLEEALVRIIERDYGSEVASDVAEEANEILTNVQENSYSSPKHRALELMLIDTSLSDEEKERFIDRYAHRSVKRVMLSQKSPALAIVAEIGDDIGVVVNRIGHSIGRAPGNFARYLKLKVGGMKDVIKEYLSSPLDEKAKQIYDGIVDALDAAWHFTKGTARGSVYAMMPITGVRKAVEFINDSEVQTAEFVPTILIPLVSSMVSLFYGFVTLGVLAISIEPVFYEPYIYTNLALLGTFGSYELLRLGAKKYQSRVDEMESFNASLEAPQVRVEVDNNESELPTYDIGVEDFVYVGEGNTPIPLKLKVPQ